MTALEKVMSLQAQGMPEMEIIKKLRDEGISTSEINDALSQVKIKQAVTEDPGSEMEQSIMDQNTEAPVQNYQQYPQQYQQQYPTEQQYYPAYPAEQPQLDTDTISEIAEQVVQEKFSEYTKKTGDLVAFKNETKDKIKDLDERLKRIENSIEQIQRAIIGKVGEYGESISFVHKDLSNIHDTMSKLMNPLVDNYRELRKIAEK